MYDIPDVQNLKMIEMKLFTTETDSQRMNLWLPGGKFGGRNS